MAALRDWLRHGAKRPGAALAMLFCFVVPSAWCIEMRIGPKLHLGHVASLLAFSALGFCLIFVLVPRLVAKLPERRWLLAVGCALILLGAWWLSPAVGELRLGSDRNEALTVSTQRLLSSHYPYAFKTSRGLPATPLPGGLLLSAPCVALVGNAAYQNGPCLLLLAATLYAATRRATLSLVTLLLVVASPGVVIELHMGDDLLTNGICVAVASFWLLRSTRSKAHLRAAAAAFALGLTLAWRPNFWLAAPAVLAAMWRRQNDAWRWLYAALAVASCLSITLSFYFASPAEFSPLHVLGGLQAGRKSVKVLLSLALAACALVPLGFAWRRPLVGDTLLWCGVSISLQAVVIFVDWTLRRGAFSVGALGYAVMAVPFIALAVAGRLPVAQLSRNSPPA